MSNNNLNNNSALVAGGIVISIGVLILLKQLNILGNLSWLFNWKTLLIGIGIFSGAKRNFSQPYGWLIPIAIGCAFLIGDYTNIHLVRYIVPLIVIGVGLVMILNATSSNKWLQDFEKKNFNSNTNSEITDIESEYERTSDSDRYNRSNNSNYNSDNYLSVNSFFSGAKHSTMNKNFKGGTINAVMGGAEISLMQADMQSPALIDVMIVMGGVKLLVPAEWEIKNEVGCLFGGVEDARPQAIKDEYATPKILVLRGTTVMGGLEIKSY
jgi:predicted membrane protein